MNEIQMTTRAVRFANNVKNLNRFLVSDKTTEELYGYKNFVLDLKNLKKYYEHHETIAEWRDWDTFMRVIDERVNVLLSR